MRLNQITIPSHHMARAVDFYARLGLALIVDSQPRYARFLCPDGGSTFSIHHMDTPISQEGTVVYFECDDLDLKVEALKQAGFLFEQEPTDQSWLWREARLRDPDGHLICLYFAGENRINPPWRVKPTQL